MDIFGDAFDPEKVNVMSIDTASRAATQASTTPSNALVLVVGHTSHPFSRHLVTKGLGRGYRMRVGIFVELELSGNGLNPTAAPVNGRKRPSRRRSGSNIEETIIVSRENPDDDGRRMLTGVDCVIFVLDNAPGADKSVTTATIEEKLLPRMQNHKVPKLLVALVGPGSSQPVPIPPVGCDCLGKPTKKQVKATTRTPSPAEGIAGLLATIIPTGDMKWLVPVPRAGTLDDGPSQGSLCIVAKEERSLPAAATADAAPTEPAEIASVSFVDFALWTLSSINTPKLWETPSILHLTYAEHQDPSAELV
uniref:Uncharacterized protein n=1 Tax=Rhizochromulina marina TaxID=1034831 RepID=A0A7S2WV21_9STRA|mmetsp:Transcript_744/g.2384  ORF Transcript_744/g.2384 Transcript_744/m.2384 type:complete len:307 (+) Transcript_744:99-1019(+)|eukprot:CAMPEP_0118964738 /NCGR_PEP_ID=MMETSP1173-20130426/2383_1 /TAXON_ID=1034831 /ORGANISM="Rhizochromulina marina cf, Strain CCMP1243" /LENGTH=306 /DNA_ID=CAMNT_0006913233 /DNA_START=24 /DNA_END=944 /DNA_ORIENTATION=+